MANLESDEVLVERLNAIVEEVRLWNLTYDAWMRGSGLKPEKEIEQIISQVAEVFSESNGYSAPDRFFLGKQVALSASMQIRNLVDVASVHGSKYAVEWYRRVSETDRANVHVICEVLGLIVREEIVFSNGVRLVPAHQAPDSAMGSRIRSQNELFANRIGMPMFPAAALILREDVRAGDSKEGHLEFLEMVNRIGRTISAFTLSKGHSPIVGIARSEFVDKDLAATEFGTVWQSASYDGRAPDHPREVTSEAIKRVESYLSLEGRVAEVCDVAIARLNLARRRIQPGDKAIEGGVCLEALLGDSGAGDLTYKLRVRTARLLGKELSQRISISKDVADFYALRSKVVHGRSLGNSAKDREVAERGLAICSEVLNLLVCTKNLPNIQELELA